MHESLPQRTLRQSFFGFFRRVLITSACCLSKQKRPHPWQQACCIDFVKFCPEKFLFSLPSFSGVRINLCLAR